MEALNTYKAEKTLAEQMNERLAELKMTKAEAALKMNYSRSALSQYLNGKYGSDPTELEKKIVEFLEASGGIVEGRGQENIQAGAGILKKKVEFFESRDFVQTIGVCQACQQDMGLGIIVGKSGQGKTHALKKYAELPRVAYIECDDTMACRDLVEAIENISVYNLVSRTGIDESEREKTFLNRYNAAIKFLLDVAKGTISIGVEDIGGGSEAANGFKMKSSGRVFSRESMKGW